MYLNLHPYQHEVHLIRRGWLVVTTVCHFIAGLVQDVATINRMSAEPRRKWAIVPTSWRANPPASQHGPTNKHTYQAVDTYGVCVNICDSIQMSYDIRYWYIYIERERKGERAYVRICLYLYTDLTIWICTVCRTVSVPAYLVRSQLANYPTSQLDGCGSCSQDARFTRMFF